MENTQVGPFLILKRLGRNRRQRVFHARQTEQNRDVALKFIKVPKEINRVVALSKIDRETNVLKELKHPNLVRVFGAGAHEEQVFFASELVNGESLAAMLSRRGKLTHDLAVEYGMQIASLLDYLHDKEIIHSKLTPDKVIVTPEHHVKVADLRLNRSRKRRWDQPRQHNVELAAYMAPEQFTEGATHKSDFYSLGVILYEILTGKLPYRPDTIARMTRNKLDAPVPSVGEHVMNCPIWLDKIVTQMLQPKPRMRPHSAQAIVFAFNEIKKIAHDKKAAVSQVTGGFNPLTAGTDKTEANRLLGRKARKKPESDVPFWQGIPFLLGALALIAAILVWAIIPPSSEKLMASAKDLIEKGELSEAREQLKTIMDRDGDAELGEEAETLYYRTRTQTLNKQAETGTFLKFPQNPEARAFCEAVVLQNDGDVEGARRVFEELAATVDPEGDDRHIQFAAASRIEQLDTMPDIKTVSIEDLTAQVHDALQADSPADLEQAKASLATIILDYAGDEKYFDLVSTAKDNLETIKLRIAALNPDN